MTTATKLPAITEKAWQAQVVALCRTLGYRVQHHRISMLSASGWPDLQLWKPGRFLMAELKTDKGKVSAAQQDVIDSLKAAGIAVFVWRPADFDYMVDILQARDPR